MLFEDKWKTDILKKLNEFMDLSEPGKLFQSEGALNLKARRPVSLKILGTRKYGWSVCFRLWDDLYGTNSCFKQEG